jgi:predicted nucleic acid-binding protein
MKLVVDASVLIAAKDAKDLNGTRAKEFLKRVAKGNHQAMVSCPLLTELVCAMCRRNAPVPPGPSKDAAMKSAEWLTGTPGIELVAVTVERATKAAYLGASLGLRSMDALAAYLAFEHGRDLVTLDGDFKDVDRRARTLGPSSQPKDDGLEIPQGASWAFRFEGRRVRLLRVEEVV